MKPVISAEAMEAARLADIRAGLVPSEVQVAATPALVAPVAVQAKPLTFGKVVWAVMLGNFIMGMLAWILFEILYTPPRSY